jgi:putative drug exporter of the RND superfamily
MRSNLYRLGRYSARRPWVVIGAWLVVAALVVAASGAFGKKLEESFGAPGVRRRGSGRPHRAGGRDPTR